MAGILFVYALTAQRLLKCNTHGSGDTHSYGSRNVGTDGILASVMGLVVCLCPLYSSSRIPKKIACENTIPTIVDPKPKRSVHSAPKVDQNVCVTDADSRRSCAMQCWAERAFRDGFRRPT